MRRELLVQQLLDRWLDQPHVVLVVPARLAEAAHELGGRVRVQLLHWEAVGTDEPHQIERVLLRRVQLHVSDEEAVGVHLLAEGRPRVVDDEVRREKQHTAVLVRARRLDQLVLLERARVPRERLPRRSGAALLPQLLRSTLDFFFRVGSIVR